MRKLLYLIFVLSFISACSSAQSEYENIIREFLETRKGVRTDLKIKFEIINVSDILVQDSINIIKEEFESEQSKRIANIEQAIERYEKRIAEHKKRNDFIGRASVVDQKGLLKSEIKSLEEAKNWSPEILHKYDNRQANEVLVKKALCTFSLYNSKLQTRQTYKDAVIILSADGKTPLDIILEQ